MPKLFILAGPNGAGKSTSAPGVLVGDCRVDEFINADVIAKDQGLTDMAAGKQTLARLDALVAERRDIAFETTLASRMLLPRIQVMRASGYAFHLTFFWLPNADMAVERVAKRVASGGHSIPEDVIRRRYERGLDNFFNAYSSSADAWVMVNNTSRPGWPVAWRRIGGRVEVLDNPLWSQLLSRYMKPPRAEQPQAAVRSADELAQLRKAFDPKDILKRINGAVAAAMKRHKERGESVVVWRDGKIVTLKPEEIEI
jgi:predicted ABC-type ATPase